MVYAKINGRKGIVMVKKFEEKTLSSESIYKGKIIDVKIDEVKLPDGKRRRGN